MKMAKIRSLFCLTVDVLVVEWCFDLSFCVSHVLYRNSKTNIIRTNHRPSLEVSDMKNGKNFSPFHTYHTFPVSFSSPIGPVIPPFMAYAGHVFLFSH